MENTIRIDCDLPGHDGEFIEFRRSGWTFGILREWETAQSSTKIAEIVGRMIVSWKLTNADTGKDIPFDKDNSEACLDDLDPMTASWVVGVFRLAYHQAALPDPKVS